MQCAQSCAFSIESFGQTGATIDTNWGQWFLPTVVTICLPGWKLEWIPFHIFHRWNIFVNHLYFSNESRKMFHYTAKRSYEQGLLSKHTQRDTWNNLVMYPLPHSKWGKVNKQKPSGKVLEMNSWGYKNSVKAPTIYSMSTMGRPSLSVDFHVHLQDVATRKRFSK